MQRSGLAAGLVFEKRQTVTKADKLFEDDGNIKCSTEFCLLEQKLTSEQKVQVYFRPPALRQTLCWQYVPRLTEIKITLRKTSW